ncbi:MAG: class I SAM-dependent methyltransferase [Phycisphaerales bacterium]|nr:MAG: class I SAM-dependent methyltransferase [Phycisphaerales bacterium]
MVPDSTGNEAGVIRAPKRAFEHCADDYARHRPGYPSSLLDYLAAACPPGSCPLAADVGAGTGLFTRGLLERGYRIVAVEPGEAMLLRAPFAVAGHADCVHLLRASAESTALADGCVGLVTCAQAFHWFNPPVALAEFGRILMTGGTLALIWNNRDRRGSGFVGAFEALVRKFNPAYDAEYREQDWPGKIEKSDLFGPVQYRCFAWTWQRTTEQVIGFSRSVSYIRNVIPRTEMPRFEAELRRLCEQHCANGVCDIPMRTECWSARRR